MGWGCWLGVPRMECGCETCQRVLWEAGLRPVLRRVVYWADPYVSGWTLAPSKVVILALMGV